MYTYIYHKSRNSDICSYCLLEKQRKRNSAQLESRLPINGVHNQYDWSCGGDKIEHIHQALVRLMAVNMFRFCDKSGYQTIYAAVERERNWTVPACQRSHSAYVKIKMELNLPDVRQKFIVRFVRALKLTLSSLQGNVSISPVFNRIVRIYKYYKYVRSKV